MTTKLTKEDVQLLFANNKKQDTLKTFIWAECIILFCKTEKQVLCKWHNSENFHDGFLIRSSKGVESKAFRTRAGRGKPGDYIIRIHEVFIYDCTKVICFRKEKSLFKALAIKLNWSIFRGWIPAFINNNRKSSWDVRSRSLHISESTEPCLFLNCIYVREFDLI